MGAVLQFVLVLAGLGRFFMASRTGQDLLLSRANLLDPEVGFWNPWRWIRA